MLMNLSVFLIMITLSSVAAQTFQYSRGWKNGKRDGSDVVSSRLDINRLEKIFSPCQMQKLQYLVDGKVTEKLLAPCEYLEEEEPRRQKPNIAQDSCDNFQ